MVNKVITEVIVLSKTFKGLSENKIITLSISSSICLPKKRPIIKLKGVNSNFLRYHPMIPKIKSI